MGRVASGGLVAASCIPATGGYRSAIPTGSNMVDGGRRSDAPLGEPVSQGRESKVSAIRLSPKRLGVPTDFLDLTNR